MRELALYDAMLSSKRKGMDIGCDYDEYGDSILDWPMGKTKIINKNYPFRLLRPSRFKVKILINPNFRRVKRISLSSIT
jgi:hypothetical protein